MFCRVASLIRADIPVAKADINSYKVWQRTSHQLMLIAANVPFVLVLFWYVRPVKAPTVDHVLTTTTALSSIVCCSVRPLLAL